MKESVPARVVVVDWTLPLLGGCFALFALIVLGLVVVLIVSRRNFKRG